MSKRHASRLQGLLPRPAKAFSWKLRDIKDLDKLELIWICDFWHEYGTMCTLIKEYGEFEFFRDLLIYVRHNSTGLKREHADLHVSATFDHFKEYYFEKYNINLI